MLIPSLSLEIVVIARVGSPDVLPGTVVRSVVVTGTVVGFGVVTGTVVGFGVVSGTVVVAGVVVVTSGAFVVKDAK